MDEIKRQVGRAHRRLVFQQFLFVIGWSLFATLLIAAIGLAVPRIWVLAVDQQSWDLSWIGGGIATGFVMAGLWTWIIRRTQLDAAIELDRRFGLKERVSSTLALGPEELDTEIGQALVTDAVRRVERIDVREQFQVKPTWRALLPLVPAAAMAAVLYFGYATQRAAEATSEQTVKIKDQIKVATQKLQEKLRETEKKAEELGLKDAEALKEINKELDKMANKNTADRKDAMLRINDLAKEIEKRKQELGGADKMKKELDKLKDIQNGPADKLAESLKEGDLGKAQEQMKQMKEDLKNGKLGQEDKEKLAKQMEQMKEALKQGVQDAKEAREKLQQEIEKKLEEGNIAEAAKLQQQLDKMNEGAQQMEQQMNELADKLGQVAQAMKDGDPKAAAEKLDELAQDLDKLQEQLDQIENLNEVLDQLADAKNAMKCDQCGGAGCKACEGGSDKEGDGEADGKDGKGKGKKGKGKGRGLGAGQGEGERPEEETDKSFYDTKVNADAKAGEAVRVGDAAGNNVAGKSKESVKEAIEGSLAKDPDALEDVNLPRDQREHAKQYFEKFRKGE